MNLKRTFSTKYVNFSHKKLHTLVKEVLSDVQNELKTPPEETNKDFLFVECVPTI